MRFMVLVKATKLSESGAPPSPEMLSEMGKFNQELIDAGILLDANGLQPSSKGVRVEIAGGAKRNVVDGPFAEAKELVAGYWIWQCKSMQEAVEWVKRCPDPMQGEACAIEIRQISELDDFPDVPDSVKKQADAFAASKK
ncbi:MAG: YciI family protein [Kofleriaceae bacterium]